MLLCLPLLTACHLSGRPALQPSHAGRPVLQPLRTFAPLCVGNEPSVAAQASRPALLQPDNLLVGGLAFMAGIGDVMTFKQHECFANMMTGNTFRAMCALGTAQWAETAFHVSLLLAYVLGVAAYRALDLRQVRPVTCPHPLASIIRRGAPVCAFSFRQVSARRVVAPAVLALFALRDVAALLLPGTRWHMLLLVLGFGLVNALSSEELGAVTCMAPPHRGTRAAAEDRRGPGARLGHVAKAALCAQRRTRCWCCPA